MLWLYTYHTSFLKNTYLFFTGKEICRGNIWPLLRSPWESLANPGNGILPKSRLYCHCHKTLFSVDHSIPSLFYVWSWKGGKIGRIPLFSDCFPAQGLLTVVGETFVHHEGYWSDPAMSFLFFFFFCYSTSVSLKMTKTFGVLLNSVLSFSSEFHKLVIHCMQSYFKIFNFLFFLFFFASYESVWVFFLHCPYLYSSLSVCQISRLWLLLKALGTDIYVCTGRVNLLEKTVFGITYFFFRMGTFPKHLESWRNFSWKHLKASVYGISSSLKPVVENCQKIVEAKERVSS